MTLTFEPTKHPDPRLYDPEDVRTKIIIYSDLLHMPMTVLADMTHPMHMNANRMVFAAKKLFVPDDWDAAIFAVMIVKSFQYFAWYTQGIEDNRHFVRFGAFTKEEYEQCSQKYDNQGDEWGDHPYYREQHKFIPTFSELIKKNV